MPIMYERTPMSLAAERAHESANETFQTHSDAAYDAAKDIKAAIAQTQRGDTKQIARIRDLIKDLSSYVDEMEGAA